MSDLSDVFSQTENQLIPGGCERCDAFQTLTITSPGIYGIVVHHDDWCPALRARTSGMN